MNAVNIGAISRRLALESIDRVPDGGGGYIESWIETARVWAAIRPTGGDKIFAFERPSGRVGHEIVIRYRSDVTPRMRFRFGAHVYEILAVLGIGRDDRFLKCLCEERDL